MNNLKNFLLNIQKTKNDSDKGITALDADDRKNILDLNILVMVDMSGSISDNQFHQFMSQLHAIKGISRIKVIEYDDDVRAFYDMKSLDSGKRKIIRKPGTGGNYEPKAYAYLAKLMPDAVLHMTDGGVYGSVSNVVNGKTIPVGFILTHDGHKPYNFGDTVIKLPKPSTVVGKKYSVRR